DASFTHMTGLAHGMWYVCVRATDAVGNSSGWSPAGSVMVDITAPDAPEEPTTMTPTTDTTPTWTWNEPSDTGVGLAATPYTVEWSQDEGFESLTGSDTVADETFTHTDGLADGVWYFRVRATDAVGNTSV